MDDIAADNLPDDVETLKQQLAEARKEIHALHQTIDAFVEEKRLAQARLYSASSEKDHPQQSLFDEAEEGAQEEATCESDTPSVEVKSHKRRGGRTKLPENLPRVEVVHDLEDSQKQCECGCQKERIGEETSEQIDIIPAKVQVIKHIRPKYVCKHCDAAPETAKMPPQPIPKSQASPGFLAYVITSKYADALPLYRQCRILERSGIEYSRNTLCNQVVKVGELVQPIINLLEEKALSHPILQMDETTVQVLKEPERSPQNKSYMWVMKGGPPEEASLIYNYDPSRGRAVAQRLLAGYSGYLQTDAWHAYDVMHGENVIAVACWAHARRKFKEAEKALPKSKQKQSGKIQQAIAYIQKLYAVEKKTKNLTPEERLEVRQNESLPTLTKLKSWLDKQNINPESRLGKAISYTLKYWDRLKVYCTDGRIEIDNNGVENKIRPFAVGRKNWLFSASQAGAKSSANLYSLIETAKMHGLNEYEYLKWIIAKLPSTQNVEDIEALLPWNLDRSKLVQYAYA